MPTINVTKDKNGMYHTRVYGPFDPNGKRITKRIIGYTEREVRRAAEDFLEEMKRQPQIFGLTLKAAALNYIDYLENKRTPPSPSTLKSYYSMTECHFKAIHDIPIIEITEEMIQKEIYKLERTHSAKSIHNIVHFYVPCIQHSRRGFRPELDLPQKQKPVTKVPDTAVLISEINQMKNRRLKIPVLLAAYCGMRESEIAALDLKKDIEYDKEIKLGEDTFIVSIIHVTKALVMDRHREWITKSTKSEAGTRDLFIPSWLGKTLKEVRDDPTYIPYTPIEISNKFAYWSKKRNIGCTFHGLRHFYASIMKALNIPDNYAMLLMGHSTDNMLQRYQEIMNDKHLEVNKDLLIFLENNAPMHHKNAPPTPNE